MLWCVRTTIRLDERLLREAKAFAARNGRSLTGVVEDALRQLLSRAVGTRGGRAQVKLVTFGGGGLRPGVDLDDSAALLDLMEEGEPLEKRR